MNRQEFLSRLEILLRGLPEEEKKEALEYYTNYFEDAGEGQEEQVIRELESPEKVAANIREGIGYEAGAGQTVLPSNQFYGVPPVQEQEKKSNTWLIALLVISSPIWLTILCVVASVLIGLLAGLFGLFCGFVGGIAGCIFGGLLGIFHGIGLLVIGKTAAGMIGIGCSFLVMACGLLLLPLLVLICGKGIPWAVGGIVKGIRRLFSRKKGAEK